VRGRAHGHMANIGIAARSLHPRATYTTYHAWRGGRVCGGADAQMGAPTRGKMTVTDEEIRHSIETGPAQGPAGAGDGLYAVSPRAIGMGTTSATELIAALERHNHDLVYRSRMFQITSSRYSALPQSPGVPPIN